MFPAGGATAAFPHFVRSTLLAPTTATTATSNALVLRTGRSDADDVGADALLVPATRIRLARIPTTTTTATHNRLTSECGTGRVEARRGFGHTLLSHRTCHRRARTSASPKITLTSVLRTRSSEALLGLRNTALSSRAKHSGTRRNSSSYPSASTPTSRANPVNRIPISLTVSKGSTLSSSRIRLTSGRHRTPRC